MRIYSSWDYAILTWTHWLTTSAELQREQPQLYESLTSNLSPDEKTVVQSVVHQADMIARRDAAEAAASEANGGARLESAGTV